MSRLVDLRHSPPATGALLGLLGLGLLLGAGCSEPAFDPFEETDLAFSIFGYLDAAADTQWVRVSPLRPTPEPAERLDATVVLTEHATGRHIAFRDSLFHYADGKTAYNVYTPEPIRPGHAYTLTVTGADGATSTADVTTPEAFTSLVLDVGFVPWGDYWTQAILVEGAERFATFEVQYELDRAPTSGGTRFVTMDYRPRVKPIAEYVGIGARLYDDLARRIGFCPVVTGVEVAVAVAGPEWLELQEIDIERLAAPAAFSNVENGLGYLGAVYSVRVPWQNVLHNLGVDQRKYCPVR